MYPYRHITPVRYSDPSGLVFQIADAFSERIFKEIARTYIGDDGYKFVQDDNGNIVEIVSSSGSVVDPDGLALMNYLAASDTEITFVAKNKDLESNYRDDKHGKGTLMMSTQHDIKDERGNIIRTINKPATELAYSFTHEGTHGFEINEGYSSNVKKANGHKNDGIDYEKGYGEQTAINMENITRSRFGYPLRENDPYLSTPKPGTFNFYPWYFDEVNGMSAEEINQRIDSGFYGVTRSQSINIAEDIRKKSAEALEKRRGN